MARKGVHHGDKVKLGGSSTRKPKANLSNTYGIQPSSGGMGKSAVTGNRGGPKLSKAAGKGKIRGGR